MSKPIGKPDRIVVALGGNALGDTPQEQIEKVGHAAHALLGLIEQGNEIIITHGNGPQVGMIQNAFAAAHDAIGTPSMDLPECGAMSQGYIGYHLQQGIGREMHRRYKRWHAATVVTQIECDPDDPAFQNPTKPIGPFYTEEQAKALMEENPEMTFVEDSGRGWRRVVASPEPKKIVEADYPLKRMLVPIEEAKSVYEKLGYEDKMGLLPYRPEKTVHLYECDGFYDYMYNHMVPSTGYIKSYKLRLYAPGFLLQYPRAECGGKIPEFKVHQHLRGPPQPDALRAWAAD